MKHLYLSYDKKLSGVCKGIGEYFQIDASMVRLVWAVMIVLTGIIPANSTTTKR